MAWKAEIAAALDGDHPILGRSVAFLLQTLIILSVISIGVETLPRLPGWVESSLAIEEFVIVVIFTIEYVLRVASSQRRISYVLSFWGIVDLAAILPFYLALGDLRAARALRLMRLLRLLKLGRYSAAADRIGRALRGAAEELVVFGLVGIVVLYLCSLIIYYFEHDAQPEAFASVFHSMWWAAITLTTVGYGDVYPMTAGGRIFTVMMLIIALGIIAVPTGIIATALGKLRNSREERLEN